MKQNIFIFQTQILGYDAPYASHEAPSDEETSSSSSAATKTSEANQKIYQKVKGKLPTNQTKYQFSAAKAAQEMQMSVCPSVTSCF